MPKKKSNKKNVKPTKDNTDKGKTRSTQDEIPVYEFKNGCIITTDSRVVKILELSPAPFDDLDIATQNKNLITFEQQIIKQLPRNFQFTVMSFPSDMSSQIAKVEHDINIEQNKKCEYLGKEYVKTLYNHQGIGVKHRFFLTIQSDKNYNFLNDNNVDKLQAATNELNQIANTVMTNFKQIGISNVVTNKDIQRYGIHYFQREILYKALNRSSPIPFNTRFEYIYSVYKHAFHIEQFVVKPAQYLAPQQMVFSNKKYAMVDNTYYSFLYVSPQESYPQTYTANWLGAFINFGEGVDVNIFFEQQDRERVKLSLGRDIAHTRLNVNENVDTTEAFANASSMLESADFLLKGLNADRATQCYDMAILITVTGSSGQEIDDRIDALYSIAKAQDLVLHVCNYQIKEAFMSALPLGKMNKDLFDLAKVNVLTNDVTSTFPFNSNTFYDENGIWIGFNQMQELLILDLYSARLRNPNLLCCGTSGSGKSFAMKLFAMRMRIQHTNVYIIEPEKQNEIQDLCSFIGGQFINIAPGASNTINIMEIRPRVLNPTADDETEGSITSQMTEKVGTVVGAIHAFRPSLSEDEIDMLTLAVRETYERFGITEDNESLYDPNDPTHTRYRKMPILKDLLDTLNAKNNPDYKRITLALKTLIAQMGQVVNGQTNVDLNNEFIVFGIEKLKGNSYQKSFGLQLVMDFIYSEAQSKPTKKAVFVDEVWSIAENPDTAAFLTNFIRTSRSLQCAMLLFTQQFSDLFKTDASGGSIGDVVASNCASKLLMRMETEAVEMIQGSLKLSEQDIEYLTTIPPASQETGSGALYMANNQSTRLNIIPNYIEDIFAGTREEERKKRKRFLQTLKQEEAQERIDQVRQNDADLTTFSLEDIEYSIDDDEPELVKTEEIQMSNSDEVANNVIELTITDDDLEDLDSSVKQDDFVKDIEQHNQAARESIQKKKHQNGHTKSVQKGAHKSKI